MGLETVQKCRIDVRIYVFRPSLTGPFSWLSYLRQLVYPVVPVPPPASGNAFVLNPMDELTQPIHTFPSIRASSCNVSLFTFTSIWTLAQEPSDQVQSKRACEKAIDI
jgi:hypothetical protein